MDTMRNQAMNNPMDWNEANMDFALLERVNPVFQTAKMTLFQLGRVSKMPEAHFRRLELHFCVGFP